MLHTLPKEVLRIITDKLDFNDRLNLCKTCLKLYEKISTANLYETLKIQKNTEDTVRMFQDQILDGAQVQVLDIVMDDLSDELYSHLADIFPNVTCVITNIDRQKKYISEEKKREVHIIRPLLKWKDSIKKYDSYFDWKYFKNELFHSILPRLEDLAFWDVYSIPGRKTGFDPLFLSKGITNAPALTRLFLEKCDISIDSLEEIHHGCPYIRTFELTDTLLNVDKDALPLFISPANSVICLKINFIIFDKNGLYLDYIVRKYPNLQDLDFSLYEYDDTQIEWHLTDYYINSKEDESDASGDYEEVYEDLLIEYRLTLELYKDSASKFVSLLPKSMKSLSLELKIFGNTIHILSKTDLALSFLRIHDSSDTDTPIKADQLEFIKGLKSLKSLDIPLSSSFETYEIDFISNTITTLDIIAAPETPSIIWIASMFPMLESLIIRRDPVYRFGPYRHLELSDDYTTRTRETHPNLQKLRFDTYTIDLEVLNVIKSIFLKLKELDCVILNRDDTMNYTLDVSCWNMNKFHVWLSPSFSSRNYYIVITVPTGSHQFFQKKNVRKLFPVKGESDLVEGTIRVDILCNHINDFSVNGHKIHLQNLYFIKEVCNK